jgi:hypothetical protein
VSKLYIGNLVGCEWNSLVASNLADKAAVNYGYIGEHAAVAKSQ